MGLWLCPAGTHAYAVVLGRTSQNELLKKLQAGLSVVLRYSRLFFLSAKFKKMV
jgi:hypothetical protein